MTDTPASEPKKTIPKGAGNIWTDLGPVLAFVILFNAMQNFAPAPTRDAMASLLLGGNDGIGPMVPVWIDNGQDGQLLFVRRVREGVVVRVQGVLVDWVALQKELTGLVADLFPANCVRLVRCDSPLAGEQPSMLASVSYHLR